MELALNHSYLVIIRFQLFSYFIGLWYKCKNVPLKMRNRTFLSNLKIYKKMIPHMKFYPLVPYQFITELTKNNKLSPTNRTL